MQHRLGLVASAGLFCLPLAQLVPNHQFPWTSFYSDAVAATAFGAVVLCCAAARRPVSVSKLAIFFGCLSFVPLMQSLAGLILFHGDAVLASLYLGGFCVALVTGRFIATRHEGAAALDPLLAGLLAASIASVGVALCQWLQLSGLGLFVNSQPAGSRPSGNIGQPNLLATLCLLGVSAAQLLYQRRHIGLWTLIAATLFLEAGAALTQSRTAWISLLTLTLWTAWAARYTRIRVPRAFLLFALAGFVVLTALLPALSNQLSLTLARSLSEQGTVGTRTLHWATMLDAIAQRPWFGWGWNQVSVAQAAVAPDHASTHELIEHSHNLLLDLMVWSGIPLGLCVIAVLVAWFIRAGTRHLNAERALLLGCIAVVVMHGMLEYPLEYAGFLLPVGLMMGAVEATVEEPPVWRLAPGWFAAGVLACFGVFGWVAAEYRQLEDASVRSRFAAAGIRSAADAGPPDLLLLDHQRAFLTFAVTRATRSMSAEALASMRRVAMRFGYPGVLLRYALASAINGQPQEARRTLVRLCKTHNPVRCSEGREAWTALAGSEYPELRHIPFPSDAAEDSDAAVRPRTRSER